MDGMTKWGKLTTTAAAAATCVAFIAGCSPQPAAAPAAETQTPSATPSVSAGAVVITGDIYKDIATAGFVPHNYSMDEAISDIQADVCDSSMEKGVLGSDFDMSVRMSTLNDTMGPDPLRVVAHYKCPERADALEASIADAEANYESH